MTTSTTSYEWGDVVLVAFPLSDLSRALRRPGLVLFDEGDQDIMLARITTHTARSSSDVPIADWQAAHLRAPSVVRLGKVTTLKKALIQRRIGALNPADRAVVRNAWSRMFGAT